MYKTIDEMLISEGWQLQNFHRLGFDPTEAIDAVADGIDFHDVESLMEEGHSKETAMMLAPLDRR